MNSVLTTHALRVFSMTLVRTALTLWSMLIAQVGHAQVGSRQAMEIESSSVRDLSLSLLRDNYDIWAEEMVKKSAAELAQRLSDQSNLLDELLRRESGISKELKEKLKSLAFSGLVDQHAVRAALFIASRTVGRERSEALQRALALSQKLVPGTEQELEVAVMSAADRLAVGSLDEAGRLSSRLITLSEQPQLSSSSRSCLARVVAGDVFFQERNFSRSAELYKSARECFAERSSGKATEGLHLDLRSAWAAFRLTRYADVLLHLEAVARDPASGKFLSKPVVAADLSLMLGVALSEVELSLPSSRWLRLAGQFPWIAAGLVKSIRYLSQKDKNEDALRWADTLESFIVGTKATEEFYVVAVYVSAQSGLMEREIGFKERGVLALQLNGNYARSVLRDPSSDQRRTETLVGWVKDVIAFRSSALQSKMSSSSAMQFFRVVDALSRENIYLCDFVETLRIAHKALSSAQFVEFSEKIFSKLQDCNLEKSVMEDIRSARLEMYQLVWKGNSRDTGTWRRFLDEVIDALSFAPRHSEVRRIALDALNDSIEFGFLVDCEDLLARLYASQLTQGEGAHFERASFIAVSVRLLSLQPRRASLEKLVWLVHRDVAIVLGSADPSRRLLEGALAAFIVEQAGTRKREGQLWAAAELLWDAAQRMGQDSEFARDLVFFSARAFCTNGFQERCVEVSRVIAESTTHSEHDKFFALRWLGFGYSAQGRFLSAAGAWLRSAELSRALGWPELLTLSATELSRAGNIFAELKLWPETLKVKSLLLEVTSKSGQLTSAYRSILDWSVAALRVESFDQAEALSEGLSALAQKRNKELSGTSVAQVTFAGLIEEYSRLRARKLPASQIEKILLGFMLGRKETLTQESVKDILPAGSIIVVQGIFDFWRSQLEIEAEQLSSGRTVAELKDNSQRLGQLFVSLLKGCAVLQQHQNFSNIDNRNCFKALGTRFVEFNERIIVALSRFDMSTPDSKAVYINIQAQNDEFRRRSSQIPRTTSARSEAGFAILESRNVLLNQQGVSR